MKKTIPKKTHTLGEKYRMKLEDKTVMAMEGAEAHLWLSSQGVPPISTTETMVYPLTERIKLYSEMQKRRTK